MRTALLNDFVRSLMEGCRKAWLGLVPGQRSSGGRAKLLEISKREVTTWPLVVSRLAMVNPLSAIRFLLPKDFASFTIDQAKSNRSTRPRNMSRFAYGLGRIQSAQVDFLQDRRRSVGCNAVKLKSKFRALRPFRDDAPELVYLTWVYEISARRKRVGFARKREIGVQDHARRGIEAQVFVAAARNDSRYATPMSGSVRAARLPPSTCFGESLVDAESAD
jgi:hypothetical protein